MTNAYSLCILTLASLAMASQAAAQTTQQDLPRRNTEMIWPKGLNPGNADVFNHNTLRMEQSCEVVYSWLAAPQDWPSWLIFVKDVQLLQPTVPLSVGSRFKWNIFGIPIEASVYLAEPGRHFGYTLTPPGPPPQYAQTWLLKSDGSGCSVTTEEVGVGEFAREASSKGDPTVYLAHELWLASLTFVARSGARPNK